MLIDLARIRRLMGFGNVERDVDDEIRFHLESRVADLIRSGSSAADARRIARQEFGDVRAARDELANVDRAMRARDARAVRWDALYHDLRFSIRSLARAPGLTALVVTLLALGVGANAATFAVADELFLRPPQGVARPSELHRLYNQGGTWKGSKFFYPAYLAIGDALGDRASLAGYVAPDSIDSRVGGTRGFVRISYVTPNFFSLLGARIARGRAFTEAEGRMGEGAMVAVISDRLRRDRFADDDAVIGRTIDIGDQRATVIGIAAPEFTGVDLDRADVWLPFAMLPASSDHEWYKSWRQGLELRILARTAGGIPMPTVSAIATTAYRNGERANDEYPDTTAIIRATPLIETLGLSNDSSIATKITARLIGVALIVLIIACANVANLLLLRGVRRRHETAVRIALGISRERLLRQLVLEALVLSLAAAAVSVLLAAWGAAALRSMMLPNVHWAVSALTPRMVLAAVVIAALTGLAAGLAPIIGASGQEQWSGLKSTARDGGARLSRLRETLIVVQGALSVVLLVGAGLFVQSLRAAQAIDLGYDVDRVAYGMVAFRDPKAHFVDWFNEGEGHADQVAQGLTQTAERMQRSPNVEGVALSDVAPLAMNATTSFYFSDGRPITTRPEPKGILMVSPQYFTTVGIALVRGRAFTAEDSASEEPVIVVSDATARRLWPNEDALGQCLHIAFANRPCARIVGITRDTHFRSILEPPIIQVFEPMLRHGKTPHPRIIVVRAKPGRTSAAAAELRRELAATFPTADAPYVRQVSDALEPELRPWRLGARLFGMFGVLALLVTTIGIYSVTAFAVGQRTHEMGVRIALGARGDDIARLVLVQGLAPVIVGLLIGIALAMAMSGVVSGMLFGVTPADPFVVGTVAALILVTAVAGAAEPGWRAARVNPIDALRSE
jgi:putative ABC transport system permease protein